MVDVLMSSLRRAKDWPGVAAVAVSISDLGVYPDRFPDQFIGDIRPQRLSGYGAEQMHRIEVVGQSLLNFPVEALGLREVSLLMERHCLLELGLQCRRSRSLELQAWANCFPHR